MARPRVFVTRHLPGGALDYLEEHCQVSLWQDDLPPPRDELIDRASGTHGLLCLLTDRVDDEVLAAAPDLVVVSNMATGFDNVNIDAARRRGVLVTRTRGVLSETTAEFTFALILAAARRVVEGDRYVRSGRWTTWGPEILLGRDLAGTTLGIVGMGGIGRALARLAYAFGMPIVYTSRAPKPALERRFRMTYLTLEELLKESDIVSLHASLTPETRHMIGRRELDLMKRTAILVNTARGPLVDQGALYAALAGDKIVAAALDVTDPEPIAPDDPLLSLSNVIIVPHIASASIATRSRMAMLAAENLVEALNGSVPKHTVNRQIARRWRVRLRKLNQYRDS